TLRLVDELRRKDIRNAAKLDYFEIGARIGIITGKKTALKRKLDFYTENAYTDKITEAIQQDFIDECDWLISEIRDLERDYRELWLRTNRPANLDRLMNIMRQQALYIGKAKQSLEQGNYNINQEIPSRWITAKAYKEGRDAPPAYLRKQFDIDDPEAIGSAWLQVVANDAADVYLNGEKVGRAAAARSGSLMAEKRRVAYWEVSGLLQKGSNTIAVAVQAYKPRRPSSANVYFEYTAEKGKTVIASDATWKAARSVKKGWQTGEDKWGRWRDALIFEGFSKQISIPLFEQGFPSQMEL
ncbi:MAG: hypothetical protein R6V48_02715, partial [Fidelibacterota bacterium]